MNVRTEYESILKLEDIMIIESNFKRKEKNIDNSSIGLSVDRKVEQIDDNKYKVILEVVVGDDNEDIHIYIKCMGIFSIDKYEKSLIERNTLAILFPYVRSYISTITTQPGMTPIVLPAINIIALLNDKNN